MPLRRCSIRTVVGIAMLVGVIAAAIVTRAIWVDRANARRLREDLLSELQPTLLANCTVRRYGAPGNAYLLCGNLLEDVETAYSYGIGGEDSWGCEVALERSLSVHQYDCFDARAPHCEGVAAVFHNECIGGTARTAESRIYDTLSGQIARNGDAARRLVVKMDVEGEEWEALLRTPDDVLERIDQLAVEFHGTQRPTDLDVVRMLKRTFYVVYLHFNNNACSNRDQPFPSSVFQVTFVNKRLGAPDPSGRRPLLPSLLDAPDNSEAPDCQMFLR